MLRGMATSDALPTDPSNEVTTTRQLVGLAVWLIVTAAAAGIGAMASARAGTFYQELSRPEWAPPGSVFGPVWSVLYLLQGIAAWLVWRQGGFPAARTALGLYLAQLALNALWTWLFFAWRLGAWPFVEIVVLWALIVATIFAFWRHRPLAAALLIPYLLWVTYASFLTWSIWQRNPAILG